MVSFNKYVKEYQKQLMIGDIKKAYKGLIDYIMTLKNYFKKEHSDFIVSGHIYQGYMDLSFFTCSPKVLKNEKLKIAIVLNHEEMRFEIWLVGYTKQIQAKYWTFFKDSDWDKYTIAPNPKHSIIQHTIVKQPDFDDLPGLTNEIEMKTLEFIEEMKSIFE